MSDESQEANYAEANASDDVTQTAETTDEDTKAPTSWYISAELISHFWLYAALV